MKERVTLGFWVYLMSDCVLFATLFATYAVLQGATFGAPSIAEIFDLPFVLTETMLLLTSSFTVGIALLLATTAAKVGKTRASAPERTLLRLWSREGGVLIMLAATLVLGAAFLAMEVYEFNHLISEGHGPWSSASLSAFFTLVGTHGLHVTLGALWMIVLMVHMVVKGLTATNIRRLALLALFWHFLDVIWIFIFTFVYLFGAIL